MKNKLTVIHTSGGPDQLTIIDLGPGPLTFVLRGTSLRIVGAKIDYPLENVARFEVSCD